MRDIDPQIYAKDIAKETFLPFYERAYFFEAERKDSLNTRVNIPLAIFALLVSAITYFAKDMPIFTSAYMRIIFYTSLVLSLISLLFSLYYLVRTVLRYKYAYIPDALSIDETVRSLKEYNDQMSDNERVDIEHEFICFLLNEYSHATTINQENNNSKSAYIIRSFSALLLTVFFLTSAAVPFFLSNNSH